MTAQISDTFLHQDQRFSVVGVNGGSLYHPSVHGMQSLPYVTSCWRGYVTTYKLDYNKLLLRILQVNLHQEGPAINDIRPVFSQKNTFNNTCHDLNFPVHFTGHILIAAGFIQQLYVHMGFHPAWKFETVLELSFSEGDLLESKDVSRQMANLRDKMTRQPLQPGPDASRQEIEKWIASTFKRNYRF